MIRQINKKPNNRRRELIGVFLFFFAIFLTLALVTYSPFDYANVAYPTNKALANKAGKIGATLSYYLFLFFGITSFVITIFIGFWGIILFVRREVPALKLKIVSLIFFLISCNILVALTTPDNFSAWHLSSSMESFGGFSGYILASMTTNYFGYLGSYTLALFVMIGAVTLATDWMAYDLAKKSYKVLKPLGIRLVSAIPTLVSGKPQRVTVSPVPGSGTAVIAEEPDSMSDGPEETSDEEESDEELPGKTKRPRSRKVVRPSLPDGTSFNLPPLDLLEDAEPRDDSSDDKDIKERIEVIETTLNNFGVSAKVVHIERGPVVTKYEIELGPGISVHKVAGMSDDFAIALKAPNVRIVAPIPGKSTVGIEVPNAYKGIVRLKELLMANFENSQKMALPLFAAKDAAGIPIVKDMIEMPHLLIAGTTGSGKSICVASIILSLLMTRTPEELKFLLVDPKMVELSVFKDIPHLISPVVTDMRRASLVLKWLVRTMNERYELFLRTGVKKIETYNQLSEDKIRERLSEDGESPVDIPTRLPYIVVVIDELADLMMAASDDVETAITRLSQKSRAVGVHLVMATQRPSVDVITGLIKSNMPARVAFKVASKVDSRTILDRNGAEKLLGQGDMLMLLPSSTELLRAQGTFVSDKEIREIVSFLKKQREPIFDEELLSLENEGALEEIEEDPLFDEAARIVLETQRGSVSLVQRRLGIGYTRAARLVDMMARVGIVGSYKNSKAREVIMALEEWESTKRSIHK